MITLPSFSAWRADRELRRAEASHRALLAQIAEKEEEQFQLQLDRAAAVHRAALALEKKLDELSAAEEIRKQVRDRG